MSAASRDFIGQDAAWIEWIGALLSDRMHHAWLLSGPQGLGKRAFAMAAAAEMMAREGGNRPAPESDPDIIVLNHAPKDDKEAAKQAQGKPFEVKRNITVNQIRAMQKRLTTRPTLGDRRCVIINPADDLETAAVNALLKSLEEPPEGTFFLLIAHQPGKLLPTVRSRCRVLRFARLSPVEIEALLVRDMPQADDDLRAAAIAAAQGSPGVALSFVEHRLAFLHELMLRIMREGDRDFALRGALAKEMGTRPTRQKQTAALDLARATLAAELPDAPRAVQLAIIEAHGEMTRLSAQAPVYNFDSGLLIMEIGGLLARTALPREAA